MNSRLRHGRSSRVKCGRSCVTRSNDQWNASAVAEEIERLHVTGVIIATALIEGDKDCRVLPGRRILLHFIDDLLGEAFEKIQLGRRRMAINQSAGLDEGNCGERAVLDVLIQVGRVLDMRRADGRIGHDRGVILERAAGVAVFVRILSDSRIVQLIRIRHVVVPLVAVVLLPSLTAQ